MTACSEFELWTLYSCFSCLSQAEWWRARYNLFCYAYKNWCGHGLTSHSGSYGPANIPFRGAHSETLAIAVFIVCWKLRQKQTRLWLGDLCHTTLFLYMWGLTFMDISAHTTLCQCVWSACLCWLEKWQPSERSWTMEKLMCMPSVSGDCNTVSVGWSHQIYHGGCVFWDKQHVYTLCVPIPVLLQPDCSLVGEIRILRTLNFDCGYENNYYKPLFFLLSHL